MRKLVLALAAGALAVTAPSAFGAANEAQAPCIALFTSNQGPGEVGESASSNAHEARPFGQIVIKGSAQLRPCVLED
jgi:hypothetical protein